VQTIAFAVRALGFRPVGKTSEIEDMPAYQPP